MLNTNDEVKHTQQFFSIKKIGYSMLFCLEICTSRYLVNAKYGHSTLLNSEVKNGIVCLISMR